MLARLQIEKICQHSREDDDTFAHAVIDGLSRSQKTLPCRYFYDARGSELFEQITKLDEYYLTRTEVRILASSTQDMTNGMSADSVLVEFGSGASLKTELLLAQLADNTVYIPIDVSPDALAHARARLRQRFPKLEVLPLVSDFSELSHLPSILSARPKVGFFPGSTIGNLAPAEASRLLQRFKTLLSADGRLIIGIDLKKDRAKLECAYNDPTGVTAEFNLNLLARINREIEPAFELDSFTHAAHYNCGEGRIEMHLVSQSDQKFEIRGHRFTMRAGESIHTENSYKYTVEQFQALARCAGWNPVRVWTDPNDLFSVHELV